jgi:cytochrome P450
MSEPSTDERPTFPLPRTCPFDPPALIGEKRATEPIFRVRLWNGRDAWVVSSYHAGKALLTDKRLSADSLMPTLPHQSEAMAQFRVARNFIGMDSPEHPYYRRMIANDFGPKRMELLRPVVQRLVDERIDAMLSAGPPGDFVADFALPVSSKVICELLGVPYESHEKFENLSNRILSTSTDTHEAGSVNQEMLAFLGELFDVKLSAPETDVLTQLGRKIHNGAMTRREAVNTAYLLLVAGHETTAGQIGLGALALICNPDQRTALLEHPELADNAVEEILRYVGVSHSGRRRIALEDIEIDGVTIKRGDGVIIMGNAQNRDPHVFTDPDSFDIRRANASAHVEFGHGTHICLGRPLARLELQVVFSTLFRRMPTLTTTVPLAELHFKSTVVYGLESLPVSW